MNPAGGSLFDGSDDDRDPPITAKDKLKQEKRREEKEKRYISPIFLTLL